MPSLSLQNRIVLLAIGLVLIPIVVFLIADRNRDQFQYRQALLFQGRDAANAVVALQTEAQEDFMAWIGGVRDELESQQWFIRSGAVRPETQIRGLVELSGYTGVNIQGYREGVTRPLFRLGPQSRNLTTIVQRVRKSDIFGVEPLLVFDAGTPYWIATARAQVGEQRIELIAAIDATMEYARIGMLVDSSLYLVAGESNLPPFTLYELKQHDGFFQESLEAGMQDALAEGPDLIFSDEINPNLDAFMVLKRDSCVRRYLQKYFSLSALCGQVLTLKDMTEQRALQKRQEQVLLALLAGFIIVSMLTFIALLYREFWPLRQLASALRVEAAQGQAEASELSRLNKVKARVPALTEGLNARDRLKRYSDELAFATATQAGILPPAGTGGNLVQARLRPAREVSGDFYDIFELPGDKLGVVVADVSDKGVAPALFGARAASLMRGFAPISERPADMLSSLNKALMERNPENLFITLLYLEMDIETRQIRQANAGHETPLRLEFDSAGKLRKVAIETPAPSLPLALDEAATWVDSSRVLGENQALLIVTDGVTELGVDSGDALGLEGLLAIIESLVGLDKSALVAALEAKLEEQMPEDGFADDITLLLLG